MHKKSGRVNVDARVCARGACLGGARGVPYGLGKVRGGYVRGAICTGESVQRCDISQGVCREVNDCMV